jgi:transcription elongation GreA/GreB family factor
MIDKAELRKHILAKLDATRATLVDAQKSTQAAATHEESRSESDKDMRSTELSYIARGQAMRVEAIDMERARVAAMPLLRFDAGAPVGVSALVRIESARGERRVFIAPGGGGQRIVIGDESIDIVTPSSPLGASLIGAHAGDDLTVEGGGRGEELEIVDLE